MKFISLNLGYTKDMIYSLVDDGGVDPTPRTSEFRFVIPADELTQAIYFGQSAAEAVTVDWGDGSTVESSSDLAASLSHTYAAEGTYTVKVTCAEGETWTIGCQIESTIYTFVGLYSSSDTYSTLKSAVIKGGATLNIDAFSSSTELSSVEILAPITEIDTGVFRQCSSLTIIKIPDSVTTIGGSAFNSSGLTSITFPGSVTTWGGTYICRFCTNLTSATFEEGITTTAPNMFYGSAALSRVVLPSTLTTISQRTFNGCSALKTIIIKSTTPPTVGTSAFGSVPADCAIYVPAEAVEDYKASADWSARADYIQAIPT